MHEGHRERLVKKLLEGNRLYPHELLEALLFNACPRRNVNDVAHRLIDKFSTIEAVLNAPEEELTSVAGVGKNMAQYLTVIGKSLSLCHYVGGFATLRCTADLREFMHAKPVEGEDRLDFLMLDRDGRVRRICSFYGKNGGRAEPTYRQMIRNVSLHSKQGLYVAYCRKEGCTPCEKDDTLIEMIANICTLCGIGFYDYALFANDGSNFSYFVSDRKNFTEIRESTL